MQGMVTLLFLVTVFMAPFSGARAQTMTITALGDSLTQGYGLPAQDGFVPQLEAWLGAQGTDVKIINAGVSGDTSAGGRARVEWAMSDQPDAVIVAFGGNDVLRGLPPEAARENIEGILEALKGRPVLLVGITAPGNYGAEYKAQFDAIYPELAAEFGALYYPDFLGALYHDTPRDQALADWIQADGLHPNKAGVARIVADMGPSVLALIKRAEALR
ncbi:MAG: acyl-CoA thioesterase-1 [Halocynthiibacter sp.]|jgi:acyl-CoA thioesterase-1